MKVGHAGSRTRKTSLYSQITKISHKMRERWLKNQHIILQLNINTMVLDTGNMTNIVILTASCPRPTVPAIFNKLSSNELY